MYEPELIDNPPYEGLYPGPVFNPDFSFQEGIFHGFISSLYGTEEIDFTGRPWNENGLMEEAYEEEEEELVYDDNWNWQNCFSNWKRDYSFSLDEGTQDIGCGSSWGKMEDFSLGEEQHNNYFSYHDDSDNQSVCDYNHWCAYGGEEDYHDYGRQQPRTTYGYYLEDDMGLFEGIFGYWPCLFQEKPEIIWSV